MPGPRIALPYLSLDEEQRRIVGTGYDDGHGRASRLGLLDRNPVASCNGLLKPVDKAVGFAWHSGRKVSVL